MQESNRLQISDELREKGDLQGINLACARAMRLPNNNVTTKFRIC